MSDKNKKAEAPRGAAVFLPLSMAHAERMAQREKDLLRLRLAHMELRVLIGTREMAKA